MILIDERGHLEILIDERVWDHLEMLLEERVRGHLEILLEERVRDDLEIVCKTYESVLTVEASRVLYFGLACISLCTDEAFLLI